jgi:hypothetical protein
MAELRALAEIYAPAERIWQILSDLPAYPRWNPFIRFVNGGLKVGAGVEVYYAIPGGRLLSLPARVTVCDPGCELGWRGSRWRAFLFTGEHSIRLEQVEPERGRLTQRMVLRGVLAPYIAARLGKKMQRGMTEMNQALKEQVEDGPGGASWFG